MPVDYKGRSYFTLHYARTYGVRESSCCRERRGNPTTFNKFATWLRHPRTKSRAVTSPTGCCVTRHCGCLWRGVFAIGRFANQTSIGRKTLRHAFANGDIFATTWNGIGIYNRIFDTIQFPFAQERILKWSWDIEEKKVTIILDSRFTWIILAIYLSNVKREQFWYNEKRIFPSHKLKISQIAKVEVINLMCNVVHTRAICGRIKVRAIFAIAIPWNSKKLCAQDRPA